MSGDERDAAEVLDDMVRAKQHLNTPPKPQQQPQPQQQQQSRHPQKRNTGRNNPRTDAPPPNATTTWKHHQHHHHNHHNHKQHTAFYRQKHASKRRPHPRTTATAAPAVAPVPAVVKVSTHISTEESSTKENQTETVTNSAVAPLANPIANPTTTISAAVTPSTPSTSDTTEGAVEDVVAFSSEQPSASAPPTANDMLIGLLQTERREHERALETWAARFAELEEKHSNLTAEMNTLRWQMQSTESEKQKQSEADQKLSQQMHEQNIATINRLRNERNDWRLKYQHLKTSIASQPPQQLHQNSPHLHHPLLASALTKPKSKPHSLSSSSMPFVPSSHFWPPPHPESL